MKKIRSFLFFFFFYLGLFFLTSKGFAQFLQTDTFGQVRNGPDVLFYYPGYANAFTEADSIIDLQFERENDPDANSDHLRSSLIDQGGQELKIQKAHFGYYYPSSYFSVDPANGGIFQNHFIYPDSFRMRNQGASIWKKMGRAELFIGGTEVLCMGILMAMPKEVTKWEPGFLQSAKQNLKRAFTTMPENDEDDWGFNYVGHPIAGSLYYNAIRSQDATIFQSFLFSFAQSAIWEYVIEGMAEQPSLQDLIITPIFGTLLGEASHMATINMRRNGFNWLEKITVIVINPFYAVNNGFRTGNKRVKTK